MGKGARNRERRRQEEADPRAGGDGFGPWERDPNTPGAKRRYGPWQVDGSTGHRFRMKQTKTANHLMTTRVADLSDPLTREWFEGLTEQQRRYAIEWTDDDEGSEVWQ